MAKICKILIFVALLVGVVTSVSTSISQNVGKRDKSCRAIVAQLNSLQMGQINKCADQLGITTTKDKLQKSSCILKCVLQSVGVMSQDGSVSAVKMDTYIDEHFPASLRPKAHTSFTPCLKLVVQPLSSNTTQIVDEFCKSHDAFVKCMTRSFLTLCRNK